MTISIVTANASRRRKLARRQGCHPTVPAVHPAPVQALQKPSEDQQYHRTVAVRNQLRLAHLQGTTSIQAILNLNDWQIAAALDAIRSIDYHYRNGGARNPLLQCAPAKPVGASRLQALATFRKALNSLRPSDQPINHPDCTLLEFLLSANWVINEALQLYKRKPHTIDNIIDKIADLSTPGPKIAEKSKRLSIFVTLTGTDSFFSAKVWLAEHDWIYRDAVNEWSAEGRMPILFSNEPNRGLRDVIANDHPVDMSGKPIDSSKATPIAGDAVPSTAADLAESPEEDDVPSAEVQEMKEIAAMKNPRGFAIDYDRIPAKLGCVDATKLKIEYTKDMEYFCKWFNVKELDLLDINAGVTDDDVESSEFDFCDSLGVGALNKLRNEVYINLGYDPKKPASVDFLPVERDFIFDQLSVHAEEVYIQKMKKLGDKKYPGIALDQLGEDRRRKLAADLRPFFDNAKNWPLDMNQATKERMTEQFNEMFADNTCISGVINGRIYNNEFISAEPRPYRSVIMINQMRSRIKRGCRDFMFKYNPAHEKNAGTPEHGSDSEPAED